MQATLTVPAKGTTTKDGKFFSFYTKGEEIFNAVSHIVGGGLGIIFWIVLSVLAYPDPASLTAVSLFGFGAVALYTMSALYHFLPDGMQFPHAGNACGRTPLAHRDHHFPAIRLRARNRRRQSRCHHAAQTRHGKPFLRTVPAGYPVHPELRPVHLYRR